MDGVSWVDGELLERYVPPPPSRPRRNPDTGSLFFAPSIGLWFGRVGKRRVAAKRFCDMLHKFTALDKPAGFDEACLKPLPSPATAYNRYDRLLVARELGTHTDQEWFALEKAQQYRCYYCGAHCPFSLVKDHATPLSRGGSDAIDNIVASCSPCNSQKSNKTLPEYLLYRRLVP